MKELYRALTLDTNIDDNLGIELLIAVLAKIKVISKSANGDEVWGFIWQEGETFLFYQNSVIANDILSNPEEDIELDLDDFEMNKINTKDGLINAYIHKTLLN